MPSSASSSVLNPQQIPLAWARVLEILEQQVGQLHQMRVPTAPKKVAHVASSWPCCPSTDARYSVLLHNVLTVGRSSNRFPAVPIQLPILLLDACHQALLQKTTRFCQGSRFYEPDLILGTFPSLPTGRPACGSPPATDLPSNDNCIDDKHNFAFVCMIPSRSFASYRVGGN